MKHSNIAFSGLAILGLGLGLVACGGSARTQTRVAKDDFAYLPSDSHIVATMDVAGMLKSEYWKHFEGKFKSQIDNAMAAVTGPCKIDAVNKLSSIAVGATMANQNEGTVTLVVRGLTEGELMPCLNDSVKNGQLVQNGTMWFTKKDSAGGGAMTFVAADVAVMLVNTAGAAPTAEALAAIVSGQKGLASSAGFSAEWGQVAPGHLRLLANGTAPAFKDAGVAFKAVSGAVALDASLHLEGAMTLNSEDEAKAIAGAASGQMGMLGAFVTQPSLSADGAKVKFSASMTTEQTSTLIGMALGGAGAASESDAAH